MIVPGSFDALTLQYIYETMPADQLKKAEDAGISAKGSGGGRKAGSQKQNGWRTSKQAQGSINGTKWDQKTLGAPVLASRYTMLGAMRNANPNYHNRAYRNNCECCVVAYEARRRGFDVAAGTFAHGRKVPLTACFRGTPSVHRIYGRTASVKMQDIDGVMATWGGVEHVPTFLPKEASWTMGSLQVMPSLLSRLTEEHTMLTHKRARSHLETVLRRGTCGKPGMCFLYGWTTYCFRQKQNVNLS